MVNPSGIPFKGNKRPATDPNPEDPDAITVPPEDEGPRSKEDMEKIEIAKVRLREIEVLEQKNQDEYERLLDRAAEASQAQFQNMTYRQRSIAAREAAKRKARAMSKMFWLIVKILVVILALCALAVGVVAVFGCEMEMDYIKDVFICDIGKDPEEGRRRSRRLRGLFSVWRRRALRRPAGRFRNTRPRAVARQDALPLTER